MTTQLLSTEEEEFFMKNGYLVLHDCFGIDKAEWMLKDVWVRLGYDPDDATTWERQRINMPDHRMVKVKDYAPKAWNAICALLGGEERIEEPSSRWGDSLIVNLGAEEYRDAGWQDPKKLEGWHCDGDFFLHYLDSREQALLVIPIFSDEIKERSGGTMIAPEGIGMIARYLASHPEGVKPLQFPINDMIQQCSNFVELTGGLGDVVLIHPFMLHSATHNSLRIPRFITNPRVILNEPFCFDRPRNALSLVEKKTLLELGMESHAFAPKAPRQLIRPKREDIWIEMRENEQRRIKSRTQRST